MSKYIFPVLFSLGITLFVAIVVVPPMTIALVYDLPYYAWEVIGALWALFIFGIGFGIAHFKGYV